MQVLKRLLFAALLTSIALPVHAEAPFATARYYGAQLSAVALNAAAGTRTFTVTGLGKYYRTARIQVNYTWANASTVTLACTESTDLGVSFASLTVLDPNTGGLSALPALTWLTGGGSAKFMAQLSVAGDDSISCVLGGAGANAGDLVTVYVTAVVGL